MKLNLTTRTLKIACGLAMAAGFAGWICMWLTEEAIWDSQSPHCAVLKTIELKGRVYQTCAYLADRYVAAEWIFGIAWLAMAILAILGQAQSKKR